MKHKRLSAWNSYSTKAPFSLLHLNPFLQTYRPMKWAELGSYLNHCLKINYTLVGHNLLKTHIKSVKLCKLPCFIKKASISLILMDEVHQESFTHCPKSSPSQRPLLYAWIVIHWSLPWLCIAARRLANADWPGGDRPKLLSPPLLSWPEGLMMQMPPSSSVSTSSSITSSWISSSSFWATRRLQATASAANWLRSLALLLRLMIAGVRRGVLGGYYQRKIAN